MKALVPFLPSLALMVVLTVVNASALARGAGPDPGRLEQAAQALFWVAWMVLDARRRRRVPCHEFGFLAGVYLPASLVWYLFWSRGWKGFGPLAGFVGMLLFPAIVPALGFLIFHRG